MNHSDYVPLHVHTEYSLLDGAIRINELIAKAEQHKMPAVAITDHGNLFGIVDFYKKATKAGIKPIIGCEVYMAPTSRFEKVKTNNSKVLNFHLILLARNMEGYKNLLVLVSKAYTEGFYYKPRIDKELLEQHSGGLIGLSACLKGEVPYYLNNDMKDRAKEVALQYRNFFGPDNFYLEIQDNGIPEQYEVNKKLIELSKELDIKVAATNDCHYMNREDATAHDTLLCIQTGKTVNDTNRMKFKTDMLYFKSPEEMKNSFSYIPDSISNTREIAEKCNLELSLGDSLLPEFRIADGTSPKEYLKKLAMEGLNNKVGNPVPEEYLIRFKTELSTIEKMGFSSYFLIVWDFINYARTKDIPVGPGRGSAAGSLIAYCLNITEIDPLKYNLLFERFLNPERISMPDIDVDFCRDRRGEVIAYTTEKYGVEHVAQIITFGTMAAKAAIRDVARAQGLPYAEADRVAKLIPNTLNITIKESLETEPDLKKTYDESDTVKNLINIAMRLEGLCRHASTHAAGVVISPKPLTEYAPLYKNPSDEALTTQFDMKSIDSIGLLKFDFLGLKTLTVLQKTLEYLKDKNIEIDLNHIPIDDKETFKLLSSGLTTGIFQLESPGMKDILIKMTPNRFEDLIALVALYRPGPIGSGMIDDFIKRKKGLIPVKYDLPQLKEVLDETYGVILYQEQVMRIANKLADFSMGQADILRKAMGKKIIHEMDRLKDEFVKGSVKNKINESKAVKVFDLMALFAKYGFNKSHSAAYAFISYQTAFLKAKHPVEFMAANLSTEDNTDKIVKLIKECRGMSIEILPPDINLSERVFTIVNESIRFGLEAVKGVGGSALESIIETRNKNAFTSLEDFIQRVDSRKVNKKVIESLIKAGAFDSITSSRAFATSELSNLLSGSRASTLSLFGQDSFFESTENYNDMQEWDERTFLKNEKESLGFYITGHPLKYFEKDLKNLHITKSSTLESTPNNSEVRIAGIVTSVKKKQLKDKKGTMATVVLEDDEGSAEMLIFSELFEKKKELIVKESLLAVKGKVDVTDKGSKLKATEISKLEEMIEANEKAQASLKQAINKQTYSNNIQKEVSLPQNILVKLSLSHCNHETLLNIKSAVDESSGEYPLLLRLSYDNYETTIETPYRITNDFEFISRLESIAGKGSITVNN